MLLLLIIIILSYKLYRLKNNKVSNFKNYNKKIAFCFLIYDKMNNEEMWYNYFKNIDRNKYNIYIHYKEDKPIKYFEKYKLKHTIDTCWGCLSVVQAQNLILKEALKDSDNQHFIWLSQSCIPIKSFDYIINNLDVNKSYFNIAPDKQVFPRADPILKYIKKQYIKKASMPCVLNKKHANLIIKNEEKIDNWFKDVSNVDEIVYITLLHYLKEINNLILTPNLSADAVIFTGWPDMDNYKNFEKSELTNNQPNCYSNICDEELDYLIKSKSLFARKFEDNCKGLENLLKKISQ